MCLMPAAPQVSNILLKGGSDPKNNDRTEKTTATHEGKSPGTLYTAKVHFRRSGMKTPVLSKESIKLKRTPLSIMQRREAAGQSADTGRPNGKNTFRPENISV